jgi:hypothetical protein
VNIIVPFQPVHDFTASTERPMQTALLETQ